MTNSRDENYSIKQYLQEIIQDSVDIFHELTSWTDTDKKEYSLLLKELKRPFDNGGGISKRKGGAIRESSCIYY